MKKVAIIDDTCVFGYVAISKEGSNLEKLPVI